MQPVHHYIRLTQCLPHAPLGQPVPISPDDVANHLCCTPRNAKLILKKLAEQNWLRWQPGRGRGHTSLLTLQILPADLLFSLAQAQVRTGDLRAAAQLIEPYCAALPDLRARYETWLSSHFGYHAAGRSERFDTLRITHAQPLFYLDPACAMLRSETHLVKHLFDTLVTRDPADGTIRPHLAHHWESSADGTRYTFYLRKGVLFHNGAPLTARDAAFSIRRLQTDSLYAWMFAGISGISVPNDSTLVITLDAPNYLFLSFLCSERAGIVPQDYCTEIGERFPRLPVGSGPFQVVRNDDAMLVLEAFTPYFRERALLDRLEIWIVSDLDLPEPSPRYPVHYNAPKGDWTTAEQLEQSFQMLTVNLNKPGPQHHPALREALSLLLDPKRMIQDLGGLRAAPAFRFDVRLERDGCAPPPPDPGRISALLLQSGYGGEPLLLSTFDDPDHLEDAAWIRNRCAEAGIPITVRPLSYREMIRPEAIQAADLILDGATMEDDTEMSCLDLFFTHSSFLPAHLGPELRRIAEQTAHILLQKENRDERLPLLRELEQLLLDRHVVLPLYRTRVSVTTHPSLCGVTLNSQGWVDYRDLWFKPSESL